MRCTSRSGDVLTIVRGQEGTSGVAHNTAGKTYSVALPVTQKFRDDLQAGHEIDGNPKFKSGTSFSGEIDHSNTANRLYRAPDYAGDLVLRGRDVFEVWEDFDQIDQAAAWANNTARLARYRWVSDTAGAAAWADPDLGQGVSGLWRFASPSASITDGAGSLTKAGGAGPSLLFNRSKRPNLKVRWAQLGTTAGIERFLGLASAALRGAQANGIYFRHTNAGNIIAVCRAAGVESTLDTAVAAANGVFHDAEIRVETTTLARVFVDGVEKGTITSNIPTADLGLSIGQTGSATNEGATVDYIGVIQER